LGRVFADGWKGVISAGKKVAIYGLGNQKSYPLEFVVHVHVYEQFKNAALTMIGAWDTERL